MGLNLMAILNCDDMSIEIPENILPLVKGIIDSRDEKIKKLTEISNQRKHETYTINTQVFDSMETLGDAYKTDIAKYAEIVKENGELKGKVSVLEMQVKKQTDSLEESVNQRVQNRLALERVGKTVFPQDHLTELSDKELKERIVNSQFPSLNLDGYCDSELQGAFLAAQQIIKDQNSDNIRTQRRTLEGSNNDMSGYMAEPTTWNNPKLEHPSMDMCGSTKKKDEGDDLGEAIDNYTQTVNDNWKWIQKAGGVK